MRVGIAILGGGALGAWAANELARRTDPLREPVVVFHAGNLADAAPATAPLEVGVASDGALRPTLVDGERAIAQFELQIGRGIGFGRPGLLRTGAPGSTGAPAALAAELGLEPAALAGARWNPRAGLYDAERLHKEVLSLGRTRGVITRPGVTVTGLRLDPATGAVVGLETSRGPCRVSRVLVTDPEAASRLLPELAEGLTTHPWYESRWSTGQPGAQTQASDLSEVGADPESLDAYFGAGEELEFAHPSVRVHAPTGELELELHSDPLQAQLLVGSAHPEPDPARLLALLPVLRALGARRGLRQVAVTESRDGLPIVGPYPGIPGLFVALAVGRREAQVAAGLAAGLAAQLHGEPVAAFDPAALAPRVTPRGRS